MGTEEGESGFCSWRASGVVDGLGFVLGEPCARAARVRRRSEGWDLNKAGVVKEGFLEEVA